MSIQGELPRIRTILAKKRRGDALTEEEQRQLDGYEAGLRIKNKPYNKGAYVKFELDKGTITATILGSDSSGNYLVEFATESQTVIKAPTILNSYLIRESTLIELDEYVMGIAPYERIVDREGFIIRFYDNKLEAKRVRKEKITLPESQRLRPGSDWGMIVKY